MRIHHSPELGYIDLDHILRITNPVFVQSYGFEGTYVRFTVEMAFRSEPIEYIHLPSEDEMEYDHIENLVTFMLHEGGKVLSDDITKDTKLLCLVRVQRIVDRLVDAWRGER